MGGDGKVEEWIENGGEMPISSTAGKGCFEGGHGGGGGALVGANLNAFEMSMGKFRAKAGIEDESWPESGTDICDM